MMNRREEIKKENKKAFKGFVLILVISAVCGAVLGLVGVFQWESIADALIMISRGSAMYAPYLLMTETIIFGVYELIMYKKSRSLFKMWDGEDEDIPKHIEIKTGYALWGVSLNVILCFLLFALGMNVMELDVGDVMAKVPLIIAVFAINGFGATWIQRKLVDLTKEMNPEKKGSIYDIRFADKWLESCDEAERLQIYQASYSSYRILNYAFPIAWLISALGIMLGFTGPFACVIISVLWAIQSSVYSYKSIQFSR